jgi:hypothetical protein
MMSRAILISGALALAALTSSCSAIFKKCTLADCRSNVIHVRLAQTELLGDVKTIRVCWNGKCYVDTVGDTSDGSGGPAIQSVTYSNYTVQIETRLADGLRPTDVLTLTVSAGSGKVQVDWSGPLGNVTKYYPNGEGCEGECLLAELSVP